MSSQTLFRAFWIAAFAALMVLGVVRRQAVTAVPLSDRGRDGSTNSLLSQTLAEPEMTSRLTDWLAKLAPARPLLIVAPADNNSAALTADVITYIAWPRHALLATNPAQARSLMKDFQTRFAAVALCYLPPPAGAPAGTQFGPALTLIPATPLPE